MNYKSIDDVQLPVRANYSWMEGAARQGIFKILERIRIGRFVIEEGGQIHAFGEPAESATLVANVMVRDPRVYRDVLLNGTTGSAEAYMLGAWTTPDLLKVIRLMVLNMKIIQQFDAKSSFMTKASNSIFKFLTANSLRGSRKNICAHYDLGNDFFKLFLDTEMMYSAGIFSGAEDSLEQASLHKLKTVCEKLQLKPDDDLLEIGTGWGGMAVYAAKHYGCKVTTTTISKEQFEFATAHVKAQGLDDRITILCQDYRDLTGRYDKLVSIEMIEAVGHQYYANFFNQCSNLLKPSGLMVLQAITIPDQRYERARSSVDFIQKYIFPGGCLPSNAVISSHVANSTDMQIVELQDITQSYARTLAAWRQRFHAQLDEVRRQGFDEVFIRMWEFYLCYCEGGFIERVISTAQFTMAKPDARLTSSASQKPRHPV